MKITIDPNAGFCFGVEKAIKMAEKELQNEKILYCLGEIVHNKQEIYRLERKGLRVIDHSELKNIFRQKVLFRAHGEPPETYDSIREQTEIIDASCPIVLSLQKRVKKAWLEMQEKNGQIVIFGKQDHPEVIGLNGQTGYQAVIIEDMAAIYRIDFDKPARMFAQTTNDKSEYDKLIARVSEKYATKGGGDFQFFNSICGSVSNRLPKLKDFCESNDVIIFVSGKNSSNGQYLYGHCKQINHKTHQISSVNEVEKGWLSDATSVGISGATSTPRWLMEEIAEKISEWI